MIAMSLLPRIVPKVAAGSAQRAWGGAASAAARSPENLEKRIDEDPDRL
ncbi:hypothetical protein [uncultured Thiodictyon sp.]|nr:hypothetical protein [uncultured Thiodictyon sp.]